MHTCRPSYVYKYIYICICIYIYIYIYNILHIYRCICVYIHIHMYMQLHVWMSIHTSMKTKIARRYGFVHMYVYTNIYCVHECIYIHIYPYMSTHACLHICWCRYVAMQDSSCRLWYTCSYRCGKFDILYISCDAQFVQILSWDSYRFVFQDITVYILLSMVFFLLARTIFCSWVSSSPSSSPWPWDVLQPFRWF